MDYNNPLVKDRWALRAIALSNRSECYLQMKKWKLAQADAEDALEIDRFVRALFGADDIVACHVDQMY